MALKKIETFMALQSSPVGVLEAVKENIGNDRITDRDLDRITVPLGGGLNWTVGETGYGMPGGDCFTCPLNQWGSADGSGGKACKEKRMLFILRATDLLPIVIQAPSTSLQPIKKYLLRLASQGLPYWSVMTSLALEKAQSGSGIAYSRIAPSSSGPVPEEQREKLAEYVAAIKPIIGYMVNTDIERDEA